MIKNSTEITSYLDFVENNFNNCFRDKGYIMEKQVPITSRVDKTVDFVGSKISPLKHYLLDDSIPNEGVALIQNCMKLRSLKHLKDDTQQIFGSCYRGMGTITKYDLDIIIYDTLDYLINKKYLGISPSDIRIRINRDDYDLVNSVNTIASDIIKEYNTESIENYKHVYGLESQQITGRNLNIAIRKKGTNDFFDCAGIIVMENPEKKLAIDMGIGNSSLAMCEFNKNNTVSSSRIGDVIDIVDSKTMKYADSIVAVSTLLYEDIINNNSKHFRKKFRQYLNALLYWKEQFDLSNDEILYCMNKYLDLEYHVCDYISDGYFNKILRKK